MFLAFYLMSRCLGIFSRVIILNSEKALYVTERHYIIICESEIPEKPKFLKIGEWLSVSIEDNI